MKWPFVFLILVICSCDLLTRKTKTISNHHPDRTQPPSDTMPLPSPPTAPNYPEIPVEPSEAPILLSTWDGTIAGVGDKMSDRPFYSGILHAVIFNSKSSNSTRDKNGTFQIYIKKLSNLALEPILVSSVDATVGGQGRRGSYSPTISPDGHYAVFSSSAENFEGGHFLTSQIYIKDLNDLSIAPRLISTLDGTTSTKAQGNCSLPIFGADSLKVYFTCKASNFPAGLTGQQIYEKDLSHLSLPPRLISTIDGLESGGGDGDSFLPRISEDGTKLVFSSMATNFTGAIHNGTQVYLKDLVAANSAPILLSSLDANHTNKGLGSSFDAHISHNGKYVTFSSRAQNFPGARGSFSQVYLKTLDDLNKPLELVSSIDGSSYGSGDHMSYGGSFSQTDEYVCFYSYASNFTGGNGKRSQVYVKKITNLTESPIIISATDGLNGDPEGNKNSMHPVFGSSNDQIFFVSKSTNFSGGNGRFEQIYLKFLGM